MPGVVEPEPGPAPASADETPPSEIPVDDTPPRAYVVFNQNVDIDIDFAEKRVQGRSDILIVPIVDVSEVFIDARQCDIDVSQITVSNCEVEASYQDPCELMRTPPHFQWGASQWAIRKHRMQALLHHKRKEVSALDHDLKCCTPLNGSIRVKLPSVSEVLQKNKDSQKSDQQDLLLHSDGTIGGYRIRIPFKLKNVYDGLHFVGVDEADTRYPHVYTRHSVEPGTASAIFPCIDDPGSRNSWKISITCPRTLGDAFRRPLASQQQSKSVGALNGSRKRKHGEEEPRRRHIALTEEDKMLDMTVVCSGYLTGEVVNKDDETKKTMTFEVDRNKAAKHIGFAVGPFEHVDLWSEFRTEEDDNKLGSNAVKVHGYCLPGRADEVRNACCALVTAMDHFVLTFGRYPFESYKVCFVDDMVQETTPLCAFSLCSTRLLYPSDIIGFEIPTTRNLVYSLASQWFGLNIVPNTKKDIWLVVGIAWFLTYHFMKSLCGNNQFRFWMKSRADQLVQIDIKRPSLQELGEQLHLGSFEVEYMNLKAPLVLFILDRRLSKSSSSTGISKIISRMVTKANTSGQASDEVLMADAFRRACEKAGNQRLEQFWNQWVIGSGCPRFDVYQRFNKKRLCVEMTIRQVQDSVYAQTRALDKNDFWRLVMEENHAVYAGDMQQSFTGPMTIRIHEADGTPYEHIVEIREDAAKSVKFEIPYNTKYKRLKRNRRQRERAMIASSSARGNDDGHRELYYLGDVMQLPDEMEEWDFRDWDEETEAKMDQESYEWIRMDADFEWICEMKTNLPAYMYASQLQQDRDVVAQQDSMLFLHRSFFVTGPHPLISTILARTLLDRRYFHGIRDMAASELPHHAAKEHVNWIGLRHLLMVFQHFFCHPGSYTPLPNDFSDRRQYLVRSAIPSAVARVRGEDGKCPKEARMFLLKQLQANDNTTNVFSDQTYICVLINALATCLIPKETAKKEDKPPDSMSFAFGDADEDEIMAEPVDTEPDEFRGLAIEEIERYRRMDEYFPSYQNCFTVAALDAFCKLMKAKVIPIDPIMFAQYLQDRTYDLVRIKACESMVELGFLSRPSFLQFFLLLASTDPSPFVRNRLFEVFCRGLGAIALGEDEHLDKQSSRKQGPEQLAENDIVVVEADDEIIEARKKAKARKENLSVALAALKDETTDNETMKAAIWEALDSPVMTIAERINMLEVCSVLFEDEQSLLLRFKYPSYWTVTRGEKSRHKCMVTFKQHFRTKPRKPYAMQPVPPKPEPKRTITLNLNRSTSVSAAKPSTPSTVQPVPAPAVTPVSKPSDIVTATKPAVPSSKQTSAPKEKTRAPRIPAEKQPGAQGPKEKAEKVIVKKEKQSATAVAPRGSTPSVSLEKPKAEVHKDSISVQTPVRPTIEIPPPESKTAIPKVNGTGKLAPPKPPKSLKRASTESDNPRPTKLVKLNTSRIPRGELQRIRTLTKPSLPVTVKFRQWNKLRRSNSNKSQAGSIRATPKHRKPDDTRSVIRSPRPSAAPSSPVGKLFDSALITSSPTVLSSTQILATPKSITSQSTTQLLSQPTSSGKPRKPLPEMRKPLPSAAPSTNPAPSKQQQQQQPASSASPPAAKGPTKLIIKLKPPTAGL
ncbi:hypothetical protein GGR54DRAFT_320969 [Hypoxylon sp. NC1633]|nr:hypothetical protein GGR54DRAFT_320969 [Hypoxylon sp. NC1633]